VVKAEMILNRFILMEEDRLLETAIEAAEVDIK